jgi:hypothetical protein
MNYKVLIVEQVYQDMSIENFIWEKHNLFE